MIVSGDIHQVSLCSTHASVIHARSTQWLHFAAANKCQVQVTRSWHKTGSLSVFLHQFCWPFSTC